MSGRWDKKSEYKNLHELLEGEKLIDVSSIIDDIAKEGIEHNKLPENFVMSPEAKTDLVNTIYYMIDIMKGADNLTDSVMAFLRGYMYGVNDSKEVQPF